MPTTWEPRILIWVKNAREAPSFRSHLRSNHFKLYGRWSSYGSEVCPMPYGTRAPLVPGVVLACPCDLSCGCDTLSCGCSNIQAPTKKPYMSLNSVEAQTPRSCIGPEVILVKQGAIMGLPEDRFVWTCPCDPKCGCNDRGCGCLRLPYEPIPPYECTPGQDLCNCYPNSICC